MNYKYGEFNNTQIANTKNAMRKQIFFLLLCVDPKTKDEYLNVNVNDAFDGLLRKFGGLNDLLNYPDAFVDVMSLLNAAYKEYNNPDFKYSVYRKLILDAGAKVFDIEEV